MHYVFEDQVPFLVQGTYFASEYECEEEFKVPEGSITAHFRLIRPDDSDRIKELFYGLSEESKYFRFLMHLKSLPRQTLQDFYDVDQSRDISVVAVIHPDIKGEIEKIKFPSLTSTILEILEINIPGEMEQTIQKVIDVIYFKKDRRAIEESGAAKTAIGLDSKVTAKDEKEGSGDEQQVMSRLESLGY